MEETKKIIGKTCKECTIKFYIPLYRDKERVVKYCSIKCASKGKWSNPTTKMLQHLKKAQLIAGQKRIGTKLSLERIKKMSEYAKGRYVGEKNGHYKGGTITKNGYRKISIISKQVLQHRYLMEIQLGRKLERYEDVHHIDGNKLNNNIENLIVLTKGEHTKLHFVQNPNKFRMRYVKK